MMVPLLRSLFLALVVMTAAPAMAQTWTVQSLPNNRPHFGVLAASGTQETSFRASAAPTPVITVASGPGRVVNATGKAGQTVTIRCTGSCTAASRATVTIRATGAPNARAGTVRNFVAQAGTASIISQSLSAGVLTIVLGGWTGPNQNHTFRLGLDMPVKGDSVSTLTSATSPYIVSVASSSRTASAAATVRRAVSLTKSADLSFGVFSAPASETGTATINPSNGSIAYTNLAPRPGTSYSRARFTVTGTRGASVTLATNPGSELILTSGTNTLSVLLSSGSTTATLGNNGSLAVGVGGTLAVPSTAAPGDYAGTFTLTVTYN